MTQLFHTGALSEKSFMLNAKASLQSTYVEEVWNGNHAGYCLLLLDTGAVGDVRNTQLYLWNSTAVSGTARVT